MAGPAGPRGSYWERRRRGAVLPVAAGVVGLAALGAAQTLPIRHSIEADLTDRSRAALDDAGLAGLEVDVTGRDATVRGTVASAADAERAVAAVQAVEGVRTARADLGYPGSGSGGTSTATGTGTTGGDASGTAGGTDGGGSTASTPAATGGTPGTAPATTDAPSATTSPATGTATGTATASPDAPTGSGTATAITGGATASPSTSPSTSPSATATGSPSATATGATPAPTATTTPAGATAVQSRIDALGRIAFGRDKAVLTPAMQTRVRAAARIIISSGVTSVTVAGHTDDFGTAQVNREVGAARALAVRDALVAAGVDPSVLTTVSLGESDPAVPNTDAASRAANRRVEITIG